MKISNVIVILRNAVHANKPKISLISSKNIVNFLDILVSHQYINAYYNDKIGKVHVFLDITSKRSRILSITPISKPSRPIYYSCQDLWKYEQSLGLLILNTSKGIIPHKTALASGMGGEALCFIR